jgi:rhamnosyltransferase subunit B
VLIHPVPPHMPHRSRIVLSTLGSLGDLHPIMGLGLALQARDHEVVLATSDFYRERVEGAGLRFSPLRGLTAPNDAQLVRRVFDPRKGPEYLVRELLLPHVRDMYEDLWAATEGADLLISGEVVLAAPVVAEKRALPRATAILAPFSFLSAHDPSPLPFPPGSHLLRHAPPFVHRGLLELARFMTRNWGQPVAELRRSLRLPTRRHALFFDRFSPWLNLALFSGLLGQPQPDWPGNTVQTGFVFYDEAGGSPDPLLEAFFDDGPPPITFTLGSSAVMDPGPFFEESAAVARLLGRRALLLMGKNPPPANLSADVLAVGYAPYSRVFARSACVVHSGGVGTTAQALRAGTSQLIMPYAFDQPDNAARVIRLGVGLSISRQRYRADVVIDPLRRLLESRNYMNRARDVGVRIAAERGVSLACDAVERALGSSTACG